MAYLERTLLVEVSPEVAYSYWRELEHFSRLTSTVVSVQKRSATESYWRVRMFGFEKDWVANVVVDEPGKMLVWENVHGLEVSGSVLFEKSGTGSQITVRIYYGLEGAAGWVDDIFQLVRRKLDQDLARFKSSIEADRRIHQ